MRPAFIDAMSWEMAEVYGAVTDQILINLAHYFPYYDARNFPRSSITYQADMLAQMGQVNKETMAIIRRNLVGVDKYLNAALEQVIIDSVEEVNPELWKAVKKGIFMPPQTPVVSPNQYRAFNLYYTQAANKLNLVNTVMLESTQAAYRATVADIAARVQATQTALDIGAGEVVTGVSSWNTATAHAIKRLQQNGITGFIDHGGHRWSAEAYVAMDIRTTMFNTGRAAVWETNQNFGNDLYQVSYHNGARPLCYPWQSKVISSTDNARVVADLDGYEVQVYAQSATSYGEPAGLFGINCKHYPTPFIPGVSLVREGGQSEEENAKTYAESQQQRGLERKIREEKRDLLMLKAQGAPDDLIKAQRAKIRQTDDDIDAFCDATGRARRQNREAVYTKREFPSAKTYDVALFEQQQKEMIEGFYSGGGAQQSYTFGQMKPNITEVRTDIEQFKGAAIGAQNKVEFWMNFTEEQQAAFKASGLSIDDLFNMVKTDAPISEWKAPNPGGAETFAIKHDFSKHGVDFVEVTPRSEGWMADANTSGVINVRTGGLGDDWDFVISHEAGHQLANSSPELQRIIMENPGNVLGRYNTRVMAFEGVYGEYNPEEAFATSVSVFVRQPEAMAKRYPETYKAIENLFNTSPSAREYVEKVRSAYRERFFK